MNRSARFEGRICVLGPIELAEFHGYLYADALDDSSPRGMGGTPVTLLCKEILRRGRDLTVITVDPSIETERVFEGKQLRIYCGPYSARDAVTFFKKEREFLLQTICRERPAILHAHFTYEYALAAIESGLPHVVTAHDATVSCLKYAFIPPLRTGRTFRDYYRTLRSIGFGVLRTLMAYRVTRKAQSLVAVSPYVAHHLRRYRLRTGRIDVVPNGLPRAYFERTRDRRPTSALTFATILPQWNGLKNGCAAIEAFAKVRLVLPNVQMLMFGTGHSADGPAAMWARRRGLDGGIEFIGHMPYTQLIALLSRRVDILVHPSLEEACPMPLIEAMSLGVPVIGGERAGGVPWTLGDGKYGVLVDVSSPDQIASAMIRLAQNQNTRAHLEEAGREFAKQHFNIEQVADRYEAIYADLAQKGRAGNNNSVASVRT